MTVKEIYANFPDQESCFRYLEEKRWGDTPECPHCGSQRVARKRENQRVGRWNCHACKSSFNVLSGTLYEKTRIPLVDCFVIVKLMIDSKSGIPSTQVARYTGLNIVTAWRMMGKIRCEMDKQGSDIALLEGVVEVDETFVGGKAKTDEDGHFRTKRGVAKMTYVGAVSRDSGQAIVRIVDGVTRPRSKGLGEAVRAFVKDVVNYQEHKTTLITDQFSAYNELGKIMPHYTVKNKDEFVHDIQIHTNTIEGLWAPFKYAWKTHRRYTRRYAPLYIAEALFRYNHRHDTDLFGSFLRRCFPMRV